MLFKLGTDLSLDVVNTPQISRPEWLRFSMTSNVTFIPKWRGFNVDAVLCHDLFESSDNPI